MPISFKQINKAIISDSRRVSVYIPLIQKLGPMTALILSDIIDWQNYLESKNLLESDGSFFYLQKNIHQKFNIGGQVIIREFKKLKEAGLLTIVRKGLPARNYITLNDEKISEILLDSSQIIDFNISLDIKNKDQDELKVNINKENNNIVTNLKDDSKESLKDPADLLNKTSLYVEHWNNMDTTTKHALIIGKGEKARLCKSYQQGHKYCTYLKKGLLHKMFADFDIAFMKTNNIPHEWLYKKWTDEEILEGIRRLNLVYKIGYWPHDKKSLPKSLAEMIYNPRSKTSWFLRVMAKEPQLIADQVKPVDENVYQMYLNKLFKNKLSEQDKINLIRKINWLITRQKDIETNVAPYMGDGFYGRFGAVNNRFFETHIQWLIDCFWGKGVKINMLSTTWNAFLSWARDFHQYDLNPSEEQIRKWKKEKSERKEQDKIRKVRSEQNRIEKLSELI